MNFTFLNNHRLKLVFKIFSILLLSIAGFYLLFNWQWIKARYIDKPKPIVVNNVIISPEKKVMSEDIVKLVIPSLGIEAPVLIPPGDLKEEDENDWIEKHANDGVVLQPGQEFNIKEGNLAIYGHSSSIDWSSEYKTIFATLDRLKDGDEIIFITRDDEQIKYQVNKESEVIEATKYEVVEPDQGEGMLTLLTCWPPGTVWKRLYIRGELVE